ncbi:hypothetical protein CHH28_19145 [Bacterioplanes sanyensis]|uniref:Uncharacterized protein n=1 Tax=Bacterioplanes sanyensis TaxID=1249553 RepID=A0A222FQH6_9GAMM|nr:hypothetical protein [Bacterioplanes sanyensis]ASP40651.1 hypothetical protein CHH28_19145 [Bacterioplanes sanyensis]
MATASLGDEGCGFWVVAVAGKRCLYYNDISARFCQSSFERWGQIDHFDPDGQSLAEQLQNWLDLLNQVQPSPLIN